MTTEIFSCQTQQSFLIPKLMDKFGLPEIRKDLAIYFKNNSKFEIHLRFRNKKCLMMLIDPDTDELFRPKIHIDTSRTDINSILVMLKKIGYNRASVGLATCYSFYNLDGTFIELMIDTFIGNFLQIGYENRSQAQPLIDWVHSLNLVSENVDQFRFLTNDNEIKYTEAINDLNVINQDIYKFAKEIGLSISKTSKITLKDYLVTFSNDYTYLEKAYETIFNHPLLSPQPISGPIQAFFSPVSVIIPCYNSDDSYLKTLISINSQDLTTEQLAEIDVILVDDGSEIPVKQVYENARLHLKFPVQIIRFETNSGLSNARNAGLSLAKHPIIIFLDSDVVLSRNYLLEHSIRNSVIPNAIFISFKQNCDPSDPKLSQEFIARGMDVPDTSNDLRIRKIIQDNSPGLYEISGKIATDILGETNYFKDLSYGRNVGIYDLPSMVVGHNMSCRKNHLTKIGGFSRNFKGWGLEDSFFGARMIAEGNYIIPVVSCGIYHLDHPPRSGSEEKKRSELKSNLEIYKTLLSSPYSVSPS